ncbi:Reversal of tor2 lethality [Cystobasidiomycetes sp. EMM_F5]
MNNVTSLTGTWSTGYGSVMTGPGFASPTNFTFKYPNTTGMSYSFTDDGYFEEAQYRFVSNGSEPHCVQAVIIWQHGSYIINSNNSITLNPIESDGRIQVQDPCAAESNVITYYSQQTLFSGWSIIADPNHSRYMLQLLRFDGALEPRMYLYYRPPNMLPTSQLWTSDAYKSYVAAHGGSSAATRTQAISLAGIVAGALGALTWAIFA